MKSFETVVDVDAPADLLWAVLADVERLPALTPSMTAVTLDPPGPLAVGSRATISQPRLGTVTWTVSGLVPGRSFTWVSEHPGITTTAEHVVTSTTGGSRLELRLVQRGLIGHLIGTLYAGLTRRYLGLEAAGLKGAAEAAAEGAGTSR